MKKRRPAASLLEVMVVMAIIIIASAVSVPSFRAMYGPYKRDAGVDSVRSAWADARARAMNENRPYRFAVEPRGSAFRVAPDDPAYWEGGDGPQDDPNGQGLVLEKSLPGGVRFVVNGEGGGGQPEDSDANPLEEKAVGSAEWTPAVVFLPDGTAREDVKMVFEVRGCRSTILQLRGLTGAVSVQTEK